MDKNERNEHFKGFAELLWQDLMDVHDGWIDVSDGGLDEEDIIHYQQIIAQRAYDLVNHTCTNITGSMINWYIEDRVHAIPDLTEWPKSQ